MGFLFNIKGQLNTIHLAKSKALWPLFEAVVNSIQSIEDSPNRNCGKIAIRAYRQKSDQFIIGKREFLTRFEAFSITDNGLGLNTTNYKSFNTAYSTLKVKKGCKGIGRLLWLKAFDLVEITSDFKEGGLFFHREFTFTPDGIFPEQNLIKTEENDPFTTVYLSDFHAKYQEAAPAELEAAGKKIIEHCLPFFISGRCPEITLSDDTDSINLNQYFNANIKDSLHKDDFAVKGKKFSIYHLRLPEGFAGHEVHLCANMQEVLSVELKNYIPDLQKKIISADNPDGFFYVGYVTGDYLDATVNTTRTNFDFDEKNGQISIFGAGKDSILPSALECVKKYLAGYLSDIGKKKRQQIDDFVRQDRPTYRYLLKMKPEVYEHIPSGLKPDTLACAPQGSPGMGNRDQKAGH